MSYDLIGVELGRMLTQWGMNRLAQREDDMRYQQRLAAELEAEDRRARRQPPQIRTVRRQLPDGTYADVDQQQNYDPDSGQVSFADIGEARPVLMEPSRAKRIRITLADGKQATWPEDEPLPDGAKFYERPRDQRVVTERERTPDWKVTPDKRSSSGYVYVDESTNKIVTGEDGQPRPAPAPWRERQSGRRPAMTDPDAVRADFSNVQAGGGTAAPAAKPPEKAGPGASPDNPVAVASKAEAAKLPAGTWIKTPSGAVVQKT